MSLEPVERTATDAEPAFVLGTAVDVRSGYRVDWLPSDPGSTPFFAGPQSSLTEPTPTANGGPGTWGDALITLHDTAEDLLSAVLDITLVPGSGSTASGYGSGPLLARNVDRATVLATLKQRLGIDFDVDGRGYALIEIRRDAQTLTHSSFARGIFVRPRGHEDALHPTTASLPPANGNATRTAQLDDRSAADAYLAYFSEHGTHYVSSITTGDRIVQVFAYDEAEWKILRSNFDAFPTVLAGPLAYESFVYYIRPRTPQGYGFVAQRGNLTILSDDAAFTASVAAGAWVDKQWAGGDCAFAPWLAATLDLTAFSEVVPTAITLAPTSLLMTTDRATAAQQVFRAAMATIYAGYVTPAFPSAPDPTFGGLYPTETGLLSALATPTVSTYVQRLDLANVVLALPDVVQELGVVANVLEVSGTDAALPGSQVTLLAGVVNVIAPADGSVPTLTLSDAAYTNLLLNCRAFTGGLYITDTSGTSGQLVADAIVYGRATTGPQGRYAATTTGDVRDVPPAARVETMSVQLTAAVNAAEALIAAWQAMAPKSELQLVTAFATWIASLVPSDATGDLALLRLDALYLAHAARALADGVRQVPYLSYSAYKPAIDEIAQVVGTINTTVADYQDQIRARQTAELLISDLDALNQNVVETGQLLTGYIQAVATQQSQLADSYGDLVASDQDALTQAQSTITTLQAALTTQRTAVQTAVENYATAIRGQARDKIVDMSFDVAKSVFDLGASLAGGIPDEDAAKQLAALFDDIQKVVAMLAAIQQLADAIKDPASAAAAAAALAAAPAQGSTVVASLGWDEFRVTMENAINKGPEDSTRGDLVAAVDILVLRGRALVEAQADAARIIGRLYREQRRQTNAQDQAARLQQLQGLLQTKDVQHLDVDAIDLIGLSGELAQQESEMLVELVQAVSMQDLALQYEYLQPPTPAPQQLDLISVGLYIASQQAALLKAKGAFTPAPPSDIDKPVCYTVAGIPGHAVVGGSSFGFQIPVAAAAFQDYTMVRVRSVDVVIDGIESTSGGEFMVQLLYRGQPFHDIDEDHHPREFDTTPRITNYLGRVVQGGPSTASAGRSPTDDYSLVTPFSDWEISFPQVATNDGIAFSGKTIELTLEFSLVAQINPPPAPEDRELLLGDPEPGGTRDAMLAAMQGQTCLMGWDAVFSYTEEKVNAFLLAQYQALKAKDAGHLVIATRTDKSSPDPTTGSYTETTWGMTLGPPQVTFLAGNSQSATVRMDILDVQYAYTAVAKDGSKIPITSFTWPPFPSGPAPYIEGDVVLGIIQGTVTQGAVSLDLPKGVWSAGALTVNTPNPTFDGFLAAQIAASSTVYQLGTLDTTPNTTLPSLTPSAFRFSVLQTPSKRNLLQLFIVTDSGTMPSQRSLNNVPEPVPATYDCSLLISSATVFGKVMPASFVGNAAGIALAGVQPTAPEAAWTAAAVAGSVTVPMNQIGSGEGAIRVDNNAIAVSLKGVTVTPGVTPTYDPALTFNSTFNQGFQDCYCDVRYHTACMGTAWADQSVDVTATLSAGLPITVVGTGQAQEIQVVKQNVDVQASGRIASGPCSAGDLQTQLVQAFRAASVPAITAAIPSSFPAISFFALKNLLFPAANMVNMSTAAVPGDLVILGSFATGS